MARATKTVKIETEGSRDKGKVFLLTEMPAMRGEKWAVKAFMSLARSGVDIPDNVMSGGMAALAGVALSAFSSASWFDIEPLIDEMWNECVRISEQTGPRHVTSDDLEEISTILLLRKEALELHLGFFEHVKR